MSKLEELKQVILQDPDIDIEELKQLESLIRSRIYKATQSEKLATARVRTVETVRLEGEIYRLHQRGEGKYWYLYKYDKEKRRQKLKYIGKDSPSLRKQYGLPLLTKS